MITPLRIDLHRHLDGNMRLQTIIELADKNGVLLPAHDADGLRAHATITTAQPGLLEFLEKFRWPMAVLATLDDCWRIAFENVEDALIERLDYVELRFSPAFMGAAHGLDVTAVAEAVSDGIEAGSATFGVPVSLIGILSRNHGRERCMEEMDALLRLGDRLAAVDLAGDESGWPAELSKTTSGGHAIQDAESQSTRERPPGRKAFASPSNGSERHASDMEFVRSTTRVSWTNLPDAGSDSSAAPRATCRRARCHLMRSTRSRRSCNTGCWQRSTPMIRGSARSTSTMNSALHESTAGSPSRR